MKKRVLICILAIACLTGCGSSAGTSINESEEVVQDKGSTEAADISTEEISKKIDDTNVDSNMGLLKDQVQENTEAEE